MLETVILRANKLRSDLSLNDFPISAAAVVERLGLLLVRTDVKVSGATVLGFTPGSGRWIAIAAGLSAGVENKTILHELYHALYHSGRNGLASDRDEAEADQFAMEVLMPRLEYSAYALLYDFDAAQLADRFGVEVRDAELRLRELIPGTPGVGEGFVF
ncbi:MAG: ImmA/IrrE family metallo-endopeptidase [Chloroflexota bacterium]